MLKFAAWLEKRIENENRRKACLPVFDIDFGISNGISWEARVRLGDRILKKKALIARAVERGPGLV